MATVDRFTTADLERLDLPEGWRAEIIDGELAVSKAPSWDHQAVVLNVVSALRPWARQHGGQVNLGIGVIYADDDNVIPDVVWVSTQRLAHGFDAAGHMVAVGPDLVVEVTSPGSENARRDRALKLALYSRRDALEYWIVDPQQQTVHFYNRHATVDPLQEVAVYSGDDWLSSTLLAGFAVRVAELWP